MSITVCKMYANFERVINFRKDVYKRQDVDYEAVSEVAEAVTPVPGGIGTVTTSVLLKHTVLSAKRNS